MNASTSLKLAGIALICTVSLAGCNKREDTPQTNSDTTSQGASSSTGSGTGADANTGSGTSGMSDQSTAVVTDQGSTSGNGATSGGSTGSTAGSTGSTGSAGSTGTGSSTGSTSTNSSNRVGSSTTGEAVGDSVVTAKIKTELMAQPNLKSTQINVETVNGVATLTGTVDSQQSSDRAAAIAKAVTGVKQVTNQLTVKPGK
jgi:hyperosmotically inducible protein